MFLLYFDCFVCVKFYYTGLKTRYAENSRNIFEDWVRHNGEPILFATERGALEYMHGIEMKTKGAFTEFEVREVI